MQRLSSAYKRSQNQPMIHVKHRIFNSCFKMYFSHILFDGKSFSASEIKNLKQDYKLNEHLIIKR